MTTEATPTAPAASAAMSTSSSDASRSPSPTSEPSEPTEEPAPLAWARLDAAGPAAREDHTWTVDGDGGRAYLFGGRDGDTVFSDLWAYDLATDAWVQLAPDGGPAGRFGHEAVWVNGIGLVVFAGQAGTTFFNDLWAYEPQSESWRQLQAGGAPPTARYGSCGAIGPDGRLWISHGFTSDGTRFADTRAYDFEANAWVDETPEGPRPVERCLHGCWWTDDGALALYAGQTTGATALGDRWTLDEGTWTRVEGTLPPDRNLYARTRLVGATLVFGGQALDESFLADLWLLPDGSADAHALEAGAGPTGRAGAELVTDTQGGRLLLFGGRDDAGAKAELWELTGGLIGEG